MTKDISLLIPPTARARWEGETPTKSASDTKDEDNEIPLCSSTWQEHARPTTKLEDGRSPAKGYDSIVSSSVSNAPDVKLYKYRFWILFLYSACALVNGLHWGHYTIMADVTKCFYGVDIYAVDWTANIFLILYIPLGFPVSWMINRFGIRTNMLIGSFCSCLSAVTQCLTLEPDTFPFVMLSQAIGAVSMTFFTSTPPYLAALWFGSNEVSSASSTGIAADMVGVALGFILTPIVVPHNCSVKSEISQGKRNFAYGLTIINVILFILVWTTFRSKPEKPPSLSEANKTDSDLSYKQIILNLCKKRNLLLLSVSYGIFCGTTTAFGVIFSQVMLPHFPGKYIEIGWMSLTGVFAGIIGCILTGIVLDRTHAFKELYLTLNALTAVLLVAYVAFIETNILWIQFVSNFILGFVGNSHYSVGLEFAAEITYPAPELIVTYLMYVVETIISVLLAMAGSWLMENYGIFILFAFFEVILLLGTIITGLTKYESKRSSQDQMAPT